MGRNLFSYFSKIREYITDAESAYRDDAEEILFKIEREIFKKSLLDSPADLNQVIVSCQNMFLNSAWYLCFDLVELVIRSSQPLYFSKTTYQKALKKFTKAFNNVLEDEKAMYRLVSGLITPITNEAELAAISQSLSDAENLQTVNTHLIKALKHLSNRKEPDYHNSIKEAIQALESILRLIVNKCLSPLNGWTNLSKQFSPITFRNHEQSKAKFYPRGSLLHRSGSYS